MCVPGAPKPPKVEPIPDRQAARLPDQGDPLVRENARRRRFATRALTVRAQSTLGAPTIASTSTMGG